MTNENGIMNEQNENGYGLRRDGTPKGNGYFGALKNANGDTVTEFSVGVNIDGEEIDIPTLVPTLNEEEKQQVLDASAGLGELPDVIVRKAADHAKSRMAAGKSVWADEQATPKAEDSANVLLPAVLQESPTLANFVAEDEANEERYAGSPTRQEALAVENARLVANVEDMIARPDVYSDEENEEALSVLNQRLNCSDHALDVFKANCTFNNEGVTTADMLKAYWENVKYLASLDQMNVFEGREAKMARAQQVLGGMFTPHDIAATDEYFATHTHEENAAWADKWLRENGKEDTIDAIKDGVDYALGPTEDEIAAFMGSLTEEERADYNGLRDAKVVEHIKPKQSPFDTVYDMLGIGPMMRKMDDKLARKTRNWKEGSPEAKLLAQIERRNKWIAEERVINKVYQHQSYDRMFANAMKLVPFMNEAQKGLVQIAASGAHMDEYEGVLWLMDKGTRETMVQVMSAVKPWKEAGVVSSFLNGVEMMWGKSKRYATTLFMRAFNDASGLEERDRFAAQFDQMLGWDKLVTPSGYWQKMITGFGQSAPLQGAALGSAMAFRYNAKAAAAKAAAEAAAQAAGAVGGTTAGVAFGAAQRLGMAANSINALKMSAKVPHPALRVAAFATGALMDGFGWLSMVGEQYENMLLNGVSVDQALALGMSAGTIDWMIEKMNIDSYLGLELPPGEIQRIGYIAAARAGLRILDKNAATEIGRKALVMEFGNVLRANARQGLQITASEVLEEFLQGLNAAGALKLAQGQSLIDAYFNSDTWREGLKAGADALPACTMFGITGTVLPAGAAWGFKQRNLTYQATAGMNEMLGEKAREYALRKFGKDYTKEQEMEARRILINGANRAINVIGNKSKSEADNWLNAQEDLTPAERAFFAEMNQYYQSSRGQYGQTFADAVKSGNLNEALYAAAGIKFSHDEKTGRITSITTKDGKTIKVNDLLTEKATIVNLPAETVAAFINQWNAENPDLAFATDLTKLSAEERKRLEQALNEGINGFYDPRTNTITLTANSTQGTLGHEMSHALWFENVEKGLEDQKKKFRHIARKLHIPGQPSADESVAKIVGTGGDVKGMKNRNKTFNLRDSFSFRAAAHNLGQTLKKAVTLGKAQTTFVPMFAAEETGEVIDPTQMFQDILDDASLDYEWKQEESKKAQEERNKKIAERKAKVAKKLQAREKKRERKILARKEAAERKVAELKAREEAMKKQVEEERKRKHDELLKSAKEIQERNRIEAEFNKTLQERLAVVEAQRRAAEALADYEQWKEAERREEVRAAQEALFQQIADEVASTDAEFAAMLKERLAIIADQRRAAQAVAEYEQWKKEEAHKEEVRKAQEKLLDDTLNELAKEEKQKNEAKDRAEREEKRKQDQMLKNRKHALNHPPPFKPYKGQKEEDAERARFAYTLVWKALMGKTITEAEVQRLEKEYGVSSEDLNLSEQKDGTYRLSDKQLLSDEVRGKHSAGLAKFFTDLHTIKIFAPDVVVATEEEAAYAVPNEVYDPYTDSFIEGRIVVDPTRAMTPVAYAEKKKAEAQSRKADATATTSQETAAEEQAGAEEPGVSIADLEKAKEMPEGESLALTEEGAEEDSEKTPLVFQMLDEEGKPITTPRKLPIGAYNLLRRPYTTSQTEKPKPSVQDKTGRGLGIFKTPKAKDSQGRYWGRIFPSFMGNKTEMANRTSQAIRNIMTKEERDSYTTLVDYFGGGGCWGLYHALTNFDSVNELHIIEYEADRIMKIQLLQELDGQVADMVHDFFYDEERHKRLDEEMQTVVDKAGVRGSSSPSTIAAHAKELFDKEITDPRMRGVFRAFLDCAETVYATVKDGKKGDGKGEGKPIPDFNLGLKAVEERLRVQGQKAKEAADAFKARGGKITYNQGDSLKFKAPTGSHVVAVCDPPYYRTEAYDEKHKKIGKVPLDAHGEGWDYKSTGVLMQKLLDSGSAIVYTDEAWWYKKDYEFGYDATKDGPSKKGDPAIFRGENDILRGIINGFDHFDVAGRVASRQEVLGVHHGKGKGQQVRNDTRPNGGADSRNAQYSQQPARGVDEGGSGRNQPTVLDVAAVTDRQGGASRADGQGGGREGGKEQAAEVSPQPKTIPPPRISVSSAPRFSISRLYTGSSKNYRKPSLKKVGDGMGAEAYGWGLYATESRENAEIYAETDRDFKEVANPDKNFHAQVYEQTFFTNRPEGDESHLLDWFGHPSETVKELLAEDLGEEVVDEMDDLLGSEIYETFVDIYGSPQAASEQLAELGIDGIKYRAPEGEVLGEHYNYVSFRDDNIRVDHKWTDGQPRFSITVRHAMNDLADGKDYGVLENEKYGKIRFPLGRYGKRGFGLLHIIEQRMAKDGATLDEAVDTAFNVAIAATIGEETESRKNTRHLDYNGTRAIIGIMPDNTIVITGYEIDTDDSVVAKQRATKVAPQPYVRSAEVIRALKRKLFSTTSIPYSGAGAQGENVADGVRRLTMPFTPGENSARFSLGGNTDEIAALVIAREILETGRAPSSANVWAVKESLRASGSVAQLLEKGIAKAQEQKNMLNYIASDPKRDKILAQAGLADRHARILERARQADLAFARGVEKKVTKQNEALARVVRDTKGLTSETILNHYGIDPNALLIALAPKEEERKRGAKTAEQAVEMDEVTVVDVDTPHAATPEMLATAEGIVKPVIERAKQLVEKAKADKREIKVDEDGAKKPTKKKTAKDEEELSPEEARDEVVGNMMTKAIAQAISESGITIDSAAEMVKLVEALTEQYIRDNADLYEGIDIDNIWSDPRAVALLCGNIASFAKMTASAYAPSFTLARVGRNAQRLNDQRITSREKAEQVGVQIFEDLNRDIVRQSRKKLIREIHRTIDNIAKKHTENQLNKDRKVESAVSEYLKFVKKAIDMSAEQVEKRMDELEALLEKNYGTAETPDNERFRDYYMWKQELAILDYYGNLKGRMPSEIMEVRDFLEQMVNESMFAMMESSERWEAAANETIDSLKGAIKRSPKDGDKKPEKTPFVYSLVGMWEPKIRQMTRFEKDPAVREKALKAAQVLEQMIQSACDTQYNTIEKYKGELLEALTNAYGSVDKAREALAQEFEGEDWFFVIDPNDEHPQDRVTLTVGRALQMYVSIVQNDYAENCEKWGRSAEYRAKLEALLGLNDPESPHMKLIAAMRGIYMHIGGDLDAVLYKTTGTHLRTPNQNYMPVVMSRRRNRGKNGEGRAFSPFAPALTPRVKNGLDFNQEADILSVFFDRLEQSAHTVAWADIGPMVMRVAQSDRILNAIESAFGNKAATDWNNYILDIVAGAKKKSAEEAKMGRLLMRYASRLWLGLNPASWAKQLSGVPSYALSYWGSNGDWVRSAAAWLTSPMQMAQAARDLAETAAFKARYGTAISQELKYATSGENQLMTWWDRFINGTMQGVMQFDKVGCYALTAVYARKREEFENQGKGKQEASELAAQWLMHIVDKTAQSGRTINQTEVQRSGEGWAFLLQFKSAPVQQTQFEIVAYQEWNADKGNGKKLKKFLAAVLINHFIVPAWSSAIEAAVACLANWGVPEEEKRKRLWRILFGNMISGSLGSICFLGAILEGAADFAAGLIVGDKSRFKDSFGDMVPAEGAISALASHIEKFAKALGEVGEKDINETMLDMCEAVGASVPGVSWVTRKGFEAYRAATEDPNEKQKRINRYERRKRAKERERAH